MRIFVSHAIKDKTWIKKVKETLEPLGITLLIAEHNVDLQLSITEKIEGLIRTCDVALFLLTKKGFSSKFVQQEIGYIHSLRKPSLYIVEIGLEKRIAGFNFGKDYISFDPLQPDSTFETMKRSLLNFWKKREAERQRLLIENHNIRVSNQIRLEQQNKANNEKIALGVAGSILFLALISNSK